MATDGVASSGVAESSVNPGVSGVVALANGRRNPSGNVITQAVVSYLKDQGYEASALKLLEEDSTKRIPDSGSAKRQRTEDWGGTTSGPKASYAKLQEWLISSLDQFRDELWPVSWAVRYAVYNFFVLKACFSHMQRCMWPHSSALLKRIKLIWRLIFENPSRAITSMPINRS